MSEGLSVAEDAREAGVAPSTVRLYERRGVLQARRTPGNHRLFGYDAPCRVAVVKAAQRVGLELTEISELLDRLPDDASQEDWARLNEKLIAEAQRRIDELRSAIDDVSWRSPLCAAPLSPEDVRARQRAAP